MLKEQFDIHDILPYKRECQPANEAPAIGNIKPESESMFLRDTEERAIRRQIGSSK